MDSFTLPDMLFFIKNYPSASARRVRFKLMWSNLAASINPAILNSKSFSIQFSALQIFNNYTMFHNALNAWDI